MEGRKLSWCILTHYFGIRLEGIEKKAQKISQDIQFRVRVSNLHLPTTTHVCWWASRLRFSGMWGLNLLQSFVSLCHSSILKSGTCNPHDALLSWNSVQTLYIISYVITVLRRKNVRVIFLLFSPLSRCKYNVHCTNKLSHEPPTSVLTINIIKWLAQKRRVSFHTHDFSCRYQRTQHSANQQNHGTVAHVLCGKY
jgi:hypothetical protein